MNESQNLQTPGEMLAAARRQKNLTLAQVAEKTKIPEDMVAAIEADEYQRVSGPIYVRSFLRTIAGVVGADPERVLELYSSLAGHESGAPAGSTPVWEAEEVLVQRVGFTWRPWMLYAGLGIVALVVMFLLVRGCGSQPVAEQTSLALPPGQETPAPTPVDSSGLIVADQSDSPVPLPECLPEAGKVVFADGPVSPLVLSVTAARQVSIRVRTDSQHSFHNAQWGTDAGDVPPVPQGAVTAGKVYRCRQGFVVFWGADDHFGLKLGDLEGVAVRIQGRPYALEGLAPGQEVILDQHSVGR